MVWKLGKLIVLATWIAVASGDIQADARVLLGVFVLHGLMLLGSLAAIRRHELAFFWHTTSLGLFGVLHLIPLQRYCRQKEQDSDFLGPYSRRSIPLSVRASQLGLQTLFSLLSLLKKGRATHTRGIAVTGTFTVDPSPELPEHPFWTPGREFPAVLRHANLTFDDGARRDIRGAALRLGGWTDNSLFDMVMNTGRTSAFWDIKSFLMFLRMNLKGEAGLRRYGETYPLAVEASLDGLHWAPSGYDALAYYSQLAYRFVGTDGVVRCVRYRLVPADRAPEESGHRDVPAWENERRPDEQRDPAYLITGYRQRVLEGPVTYLFEAQVRDLSDDPEVYHSGKSWNDVPWLRVGRVAIETALPDEVTERLCFNIGNHPKSLGLLPATGYGDYNALAQLRVGVYRASSTTRFGSRTRGRPAWDYDLHNPLPRARQRGRRGPQGYVRGRLVTSYTPRSLWRLVQFGLDIVLGRLGVVSPVGLQRFHPESLTMRQEQAEKGSSRGDVAFGDRLLNGFYPVPLAPVADGGDRLRATFDWSEEQFEGVLALPNSQVVLQVDEGRLIPEEITLQFREEGQMGAHPRLEPPETFVPDDGAKWQLAKSLVRNCIAAEGQGLGHFIECHVNVEQYSVAAHRRLDGHPVGRLLFPHLKGVVEINRQGEGAIYGDGGILFTNTAIANASQTSLFARRLGELNWRGWRPRPPICSADRYARIAGLYWEIVRGYVAECLSADRAEIEARWEAVHGFSRDLVLFSAPFSPPKANYRAEGAEAPPVDASSTNRARKALSPLTLRATNPQQEDWDNLEQLCAYVIFHATLYHTWTNDKMHDDLGEVAYSSGGVPSTDVRAALEAGRSEEFFPPPYQTAYQLFFVNYLSQLRYGLLMRNECHDVRAPLIDALERHREAFAELGLDVEVIRTCINI